MSTRGEHSSGSLDRLPGRPTSGSSCPGSEVICADAFSSFLAALRRPLRDLGSVSFGTGRSRGPVANPGARTFARSNWLFLRPSGLLPSGRGHARNRLSPGTTDPTLPERVAEDLGTRLPSIRRAPPVGRDRRPGFSSARSPPCPRWGPSTLA